jgi:hypothetical protein
VTTFDISSREKHIVRPVTDDGLVGYDQFDQFSVTKIEEDGAEISWFIADVRGRTCLMCDRGWEPTGPSMADQMVWEVSKTIVHTSCFVRHGALCQRELFWEAVVAAKIRFRGLVAIENGYWPASDPWAKQPFYEAELMDHSAKLILGRRKRVYHVQVVPQGGTKLEWYGAAAIAFEKESVTKEFSDRSVLLHAWLDDKLREYLKRLAELAGYDDKPERRKVDGCR